MAKVIKQHAVLTDYDEDADVLYISFGKPRKAVGIEINVGDVVRVDPFNDAVVGITIIDFGTRYGDRPGRTLTEKSKGIVAEILKNFAEYCRTQRPPIDAASS